MGAAKGKWAVVGDLMISVTPPGAVSDDDFGLFLQDLRRAPVTKLISASLGKPEATSIQRKQAAEVMKSRSIRTASITDDTLVRGLVTALGWLGANIKAFSWADTRAALQYLDVQEPLATKALDALAKLRKDVEASIR